MVVRATEAEIDVVRTNPADAIDVFKAVGDPRAARAGGLRGLLRAPLGGGEGARPHVLGVERGRHARRRLSGFYQQQIEKLADLVVFRQDPGREAYDVVVAETPHEATRLEEAAMHEVFGIPVDTLLVILAVALGVALGVARGARAPQPDPPEARRPQRRAPARPHAP